MGIVKLYERWLDSNKTVKNIFMNDIPFISIIIPVRNGEKLLPQCLESLKAQSYSLNRCELIISDGMSTDSTVKIAKNYGAITVQNLKLRVGPGRNEGFNVSKGELIAFSDDDCVMDKDWLTNSVKYFADNNVGGISGPTITKNLGGPLGEAIGLVFDLAAGTGISAHRSNDDKVKEVDDLPGCNAIYRREVLGKVFPIDESLITGEDVEMNRLIRRQGYKLLYVPDVKLWHYRRPNVFRFYRQMYRFAIGRVQVGRKDHKLFKAPHILMGVAIPAILLYLATVSLLEIDHMNSVWLPFCLLLAIGAVYALIRTRLFWGAVYFPIAVLTMVIAWSLGFIHECVFPIKIHEAGENAGK